MLQYQSVRSIRLNNLKRKAAALAVGIISLEACHESAQGGLEDLAWEISDELEGLSDELHPNGTGVPTLVRS